MNSIEAFILRQEQLGKSQQQSAPRSTEFERLTIDQKRADALSAICGNFLSEISETVAPQRRPLTVNVTIDLPTLLGLAENPGQLAGYGPIPASVARTTA